MNHEHHFTKTEERDIGERIRGRFAKDTKSKEPCTLVFRKERLEEWHRRNLRTLVA